MGLFGGLRKQSSVKHNGKRVSDIVESNHRAHTGEPGGERADLAGAQLSRVDFGGADLTDADLREGSFASYDPKKGLSFSGDSAVWKDGLGGVDLRGCERPGSLN